MGTRRCRVGGRFKAGHGCGLAWAGVVVWAIAPPALADGTIPLGDDAALMAGAVIADGVGPASAWYNPAGLSELPGSSLQFSGSFYGVRVRRVPEGFSLSGREQASHGVELRDRAIRAVPSALVFTHQFEPGLTFALGLFTSEQDAFSFAAHIDDVELFREGDARPWRVSSGADVSDRKSSYVFGPSVGWRINPELRMGLGVWVVQRSREREFQVWSRGVTDSGSESFEQVRGRLSETRWGGRLSLGIQWRAPGGLSIGAVVRTPELSLFYWPDSQVMAFVGVDGQRAEFDVPIARQHLRSHIGIAQTWSIELGLAYNRGRLRWALQGDIRPGNARDPDVARTSFRVATGARVDLSEGWALGSGIYFDGNSALRRGYRDNLNHVGIGVGGVHRRRVGPVELSTTIAVSYSLGFGRAATVHYAWGSDPARIPVPDRSLSGTDRIIVPLVTGRSEAQSHDLGVHIGSTMRF